MKEYPKIDTLLERDETFKVTNVLKRLVLADIAKWIVTEKVDGTNIRVSYSRGETAIKVGGRSDNAQLHTDLVLYLLETFTPKKMAVLFTPESDAATRITLFGEGYGAGIQKGGSYRPDKAFILFDVLIELREEAWWQDDATVTDFANRLGIQRVPILGEWSLPEIIERVQTGIPSVVAEGRIPMEGIVARPREPLFDKRGQRLILKLKTKDYVAGKR